MKYQKNLDALKKLKKPDAVIFDWDNTLVDTWPLIHSAINEAMRSFNRQEWSLQYTKDSIHKAMRDSFPEIFGDDWVKAGEIYKNSYRKNHLEKLQFLPKAIELVAALDKIGAVQFVVSNKIGVTLRKEVKKLGVEDRFFCAIGSMDASSDKPSVAPVDLALSGSGIDKNKHHIWFVGDSISDVDCAYNCEFEPVICAIDGEISKTIAPGIYENGRNGEGAIATFFDHQQIIDVVEGF